MFFETRRLLAVIASRDVHAVRRALAGNPALAKARDREGCTLLHHAAFRRDEGMVRTFLQAGANPNARDRRLGSTPLHGVAANGDDWVGVAAELVRHGADVEARNNAGETPLEVAARCAGIGLTTYTGMARLLREHGATYCGEQWYSALGCIGRAGLQEEIEELYLGGYDLAELPPSIGVLGSRVKKLNLRANRLSTLPPQIGNCTHLVELNVSENHLETLPIELTALKRLTALILYKNRLASIPEAVLTLGQLEKLWLDDNHISAVPSGIGALAHLRELFLQNNGVSAIASEIGRLKNLVSLNLANNQLTSLPPEILKLRRLEFLDVSGNQLAVPGDLVARKHEPWRIVEHVLRSATVHGRR